MKIKIKGYTRKGKKGAIIVKSYDKGIGVRHKNQWNPKVQSGEEYKQRKAEVETDKTPEEVLEEMQEQMKDKMKERRKEKLDAKKDESKTTEKDPKNVKDSRTTYAKKAPEPKKKPYDGTKRMTECGITEAEWDRLARENSAAAYRKKKPLHEMDEETKQKQREELATKRRKIYGEYVKRGEAIPFNGLPVKERKKMSFWERLDNKVSRFYADKGVKYKPMVDYKKLIKDKYEESF